MKYEGFSVHYLFDYVTENDSDTSKNGIYEVGSKNNGTLLYFSDYFTD